MLDVRLYGPHWSAYTRTARLTLEEKPVDYELIEVDFSSGKMPRDQTERHPFAKVPVLDHQGYLIYETSAICRYVDAGFEGTPLAPTLPQQLGRMAQIVAILDNYLSSDIRLGFFNELTVKPLMGMQSDMVRVSAARKRIAEGLSAIEELCEGNGRFLVGEQVSLADFHAAPLFDFLEKTRGGSELLEGYESLRGWWEIMSNRESMKATAIDISVFSR